MLKTNQVPLLVVEDSDEDFEVLQILMEDLKVTQPIYRCKTGDHALEFLDPELASTSLDSLSEGDLMSQASSVSQLSTRPSVILLDLNLPGVDGREILEHVKQDQNLRGIPVVIFTTSSDPKDIQLCYEKGANGYLIKPVDVDELEKKIQAFVEYWLDANTPPRLGPLVLCSRE